MKRAYAFLGVLLLGSVGSVYADKQTTDPGQQSIVARRTKAPPVVDGRFAPGEWSAAIPIHVNAVKPEQAPGLVPWSGVVIMPPDNQDDSSFKVFVMYDDNYLYVAVDVADDKLIADAFPGLSFLDDVVELYIDGDNQSDDLNAIAGVPGWYGVLPNNEGYQLDTSVGGARDVYPVSLVQVDWDSAAGLRPRGFLVEARISLDSINTIDNSWWTNPAMTPADLSEGGDPTQSYPPGVPFLPVFRRPQPGDKIGFNVTVGDDDCGRLPGSENPWDDSYGRTDLSPNPSSYIAWDGSSANWFYADEPAWGTLYFAP